MEKFKKEFREWCGFELEAETKQDIVDEIKTRQWQMECDINAQAKSLNKLLNELLPDED